MEFDELLMNEVRKYSFLWNKDEKYYKDWRYKDGTWETIAKNLNSTSQTCKAKWKNLRDTFVKQYNGSHLGSGYAAPNELKWKHFESMLFIKDNIKIRRTNISFPARSISDDEQKTVNIESTVAAEENIVPSYTTMLNSMSSNLCAVSSGVERKRDITNTEKSIESEDELYGRALAASLEKYPPLIKSKIKLKIQQAFLEADQDFEQQTNQIMLHLKILQYRSDKMKYSPDR